MLPYFFVFFLTCAILWIAERHRVDGDTLTAGALAGLALALPCALAGARDVGVGVDMNWYGEWLYSIAANSPSLPAFIDAALNSNIHMELLFALQAFVTAKLTGSTFWYYFVIELLMIIPVYKAMREFDGNAPLWLCMCLYLVMFFGYGLNIMRQFVAMSFILLAFVRMYKRRYISAVVLFVCAVLFHTSALIGLIPLVAWPIFFRIEKDGFWGARDYSRVVFLLIALVGVAIFFNLQGIMAWLTSLDTLSKYSYALSYNGSSHRAYYVIYGVYFVVLMLLARDVEPRNKSAVLFLLCVVFLVFPINSMEASSETIARMSNYMLIFSIPLFSLVYKKPKRLGDTHVLAPVALCCCIVAFLFFHVVNGVGDVVPYTSTLLGI